MANPVSITRSPQISNREMRQMLTWLMGMAENEQEPAGIRKHACVASLFMSELFEIENHTGERLVGLLTLLNDIELNAKSARSRDKRKIA